MRPYPRVTAAAAEAFYHTNTGRIALLTCRWGGDIYRARAFQRRLFGANERRVWHAREGATHTYYEAHTGTPADRALTF